MKTKRVAIIGGGIAGLTAAWQIAQFAQAGAPIEAQLFESSPRLGGIVETVHRDGFLIECGPDAWVSEKPWARDLALELGLADDLLLSDDTTRKTHIHLDGQLEAMPDGMRMMVPVDLAALDASPLFTPSAKQAYHDELTRAAELKASSPSHDESIATFTRRHFGEEVLTRIAAPLLSGVLGGDVETLSMHAVMPQFVAMEHSHGSLIAALQARASRPAPPIFTTLRSGLGTLTHRLLQDTPPHWLHPNTTVTALTRTPHGWILRLSQSPAEQTFDAVFLATPPYITRYLLHPLDPQASTLLHMNASSAIVIALAYTNAHHLAFPPGFGFLVPPSSENKLLACTFVDQKFPGRVPPGARLLRAFFGAHSAEALLSTSDEQLSTLAQHELTRVLGPLPTPAFSVVRRWPRSLPQYAVGHLTRMAALDSRIAALPGLTLLGNGYRGVGLPDLIRDARRAARSLVPTEAEIHL